MRSNNQTWQKEKESENNEQIKRVRGKPRIQPVDTNLGKGKKP